MDKKHSEEVTTRRRAILFWMQGKRPCEILRRMGRSRKWFYKWLRRFKEHAWEGLDDAPRRPHARSQGYPNSTRHLVLQLRRRAQRRRVGLIGARALRNEIKQQRLVRKVPALSTINRWLKAEGLSTTQPQVPAKVYYPAPHLPTERVGQAMDWTSRYLEGGEQVFAFHTLDVQTQALLQTLTPDKTGVSLHRHVLEVWQKLGLPDFLQLDNDAAFTGSGKTPRRIGAFVRLALYLGIELIFIPPAEPKRNGVIERVNGLWGKSFWERNHFRSLTDLRRKRYRFIEWYEHRYFPQSLGGKTVAQAQRGQQRIRLTAAQAHALPEDLPITYGRIHFIRRVSTTGEIHLLNEMWKVGKSLAHRYVWATVITHAHRLEIYHRRSERAAPRLIKRFNYQLPEVATPLRPEYRRHARRCPILALLWSTSVIGR
jgi:putative transposase